VDDPEPLWESLARLGLIGPGERPALTRLTGGVSSDVFRLDLPTGPVCVKRALGRLRVAAEWTAPRERADYEVAWLRVAAEIAGVRAPRVIAHDAIGKLFVMSYLEPAQHPVWKAELAAGRIDPILAAEVGRAVGRMHAATAGDPRIEQAFDTAHLFNALRVEPYLLAAAAAHPDLADDLRRLAARTLAARIALVHGDVSPKNILAGPDGPVLLDAECASYGDPAFDLAFVSSHLLLKTIWRPPYAAAYLEALTTLLQAYRQEVAWEPVAALERRAAALTAALLLARVDGKSPVEYLTKAWDKDTVRRLGRPLVRAPAPTMTAMVEAWGEALEQA
jgi:tRNA A-37 threonylcarbamoyl transferase component Bud32